MITVPTACAFAPTLRPLWHAQATQGFASKGVRSGGQLRAVTKQLGRTVKSVGGGQSLAVAKAGAGIGVVDVPSGRVVGGALGGKGGVSLPLRKALGGIFLPDQSIQVPCAL